MLRRCLVMILALALSASSLVRAADKEFYEHYYTWDYQGKKYMASLPIKTLQASPDFSLDSRQIPKTFKEIVTIARTQLNKITKSAEGWRLSTITLNPASHNPNKWFYAVGFDSSRPEPSYITILVTIDGTLGIVKEIQERIIE